MTELDTDTDQVAWRIMDEAIRAHEQDGVFWAAGKSVCSCGAAIALVEYSRHRAEAVLDALDKAGRLLPDGGVTWEEWAASDPVRGHRTIRTTRDAAQHTVRVWGGRSRVVGRRRTDWLDGTTLTTPWREVTADGQ